jgi:rod shape determining protein RodA
MIITRPRRLIVAIVLCLLTLGLVCLFSSCHQKGVFIKQEIFSKQVMWMAVGLAVMFLVSFLDYRRWQFFVVPLFVVACISLSVVLVAGRAIMGAQRWISLGEVSFQPSEMGKFALILALARYFSARSVQGIQGGMRRVDPVRGLILPLLITLVPVGLVMVQPDLGTAIVYLFIFMSMAFLAEIPKRYIVFLLSAGLLAFPFFWHFLREYQKLRLLVFLNPSSDPLGAGYTIIQSKIAIGSGQLFGKGWMSGTQSQLNFLAERHTDFIFSVWGEEWGFAGSLALIACYAALVFLILRVAETAKDGFGRLLGVGVAAFIFFHAFINIAMNVGLCPVVGLPLPFVSYGGSSLVINLMAIGIVLNIARQK